MRCRLILLISEHPIQQGFNIAADNDLDEEGGRAAAERLSFDYRVVMDVQFIMIMTIFE